MDKSFDFGALLRKNVKKHKSKPAQFVSVSSGIQKRLETNTKHRRSTRQTIFDTLRTFIPCESPVPEPLNEAQKKAEHRRQQLEKWKVEKEQKKKELASQKKKPFIVGVGKLPPLPPPPAPQPSASGRVTRSQTRKATTKPKEKTPAKPVPKPKTIQSFAPKDASFKPPILKNIPKLPILAPPTKAKSSKSSVTFNPVVPNVQMRSKPRLTRQNAINTQANSKNTVSKVTSKPAQASRSTVTKAAPKTKVTIAQSSSSSSDIEPKKVIKRTKTPAKPKPSQKAKVTANPPLKLVPATSSERSNSNESVSSPLKKRRSRKSITTSNSDTQSEDLSADDKCTVMNKTPTSPQNINSSISSGSSGTKISTDVEFVKDGDDSPVIPMRKSFSTPKNRVPKSESSSEEKLRSPKSPIDLSLTPEQIEFAVRSPHVTMSRGKENARKEMKWKRDEGYLDADVSNIDSIEPFRKQLSSEVKRLTDLADTWDKILSQTILPEPVQERVLSAVGQTRLLVSQKLCQFRGLVERAARPDAADTLVTTADLQGFWDMLFMQIEDVDMRFKKLNEMQARDWAEEVPPPPLPARPPRPPRPARAPRATSNVPSRLRDVIAAARKAKKDGLLPPSAEGEKTFEAPAFFTVSSPVRSPRPISTPNNKQTLLKHVLSNEAKKASSKKSTPFAMLHASIMAKSAECEGVQPLPKTPEQTISFPTPGRSILKSANASVSKPDKKSIKVVLFDQSDTETDSELTSDSKYLTPAKHLEENSPQEKNKRKCKSEGKENSVGRRTIQRKSLNSSGVDNKCLEENLIIGVRTRSQRKSLQASGVQDKFLELTVELHTPRKSSERTPKYKKDAKTVVQADEGILSPSLLGSTMP